MVAVPSIGRASGIAPRRAAREAEATRELYERYARGIYSYCLRQLGSKEEAEDATQSTFLNAFRGYIRGVDPEYESAWIFKIAENVCLTRRRSSSRRRRVEAASDLESMQDYVAAHQADSDELIRLPEALDAMPEQQRRALLLREWQGLSYKEISDELDLSQAAVETLLFRARRSLAASLIDEPQQKKGLAKRMRAGGDLGSLVTLVKSILFTGGAKVAATVATVAATSVVAASPVARHVVEHVVDPTPPTAKHHVSKQPSSKQTANVSRITGAGAAAVVAHHANLGTHASVTRAHRPVAKHVTAARLATTAAPLHASSVSHVEAATADAPTTATAATPPTTAVADPAPTAPAPPTTQPTSSTPPTTSTPPSTTQPTSSAPPTTSTPPTTKDKDTTPSTKDKGTGTSTSTSTSNGTGKSTTLTLSPTQPTPTAAPGTSPTPSPTQPSTTGTGSGQDKNSKTPSVTPTTTLTPTTTPATTPSVTPTTQPATTGAPAATTPTPSTTITSSKTLTPVSTPLPENPTGHKK